MAEANITNLPDAITGMRDIKAGIEKLNTESSLILLRHKTLLVTMAAMCGLLIEDLRTIEYDIRTS